VWAEDLRLWDLIAYEKERSSDDALIKFDTKGGELPFAAICVSDRSADNV